MNFLQTASTKAIKHLVLKAIPASLRSAIRSRLFSEDRYGAPLSPVTIKLKKEKGSSKPSMTLYDTGELSMGIKGKMTGKEEGKVYTRGKSDDIQEWLFGGTKKMPARPLFNLELPGGGGMTITKASLAYYASEMGKSVKKEIGKAVKQVNQVK